MAIRKRRLLRKKPLKRVIEDIDIQRVLRPPIYRKTTIRSAQFSECYRYRYGLLVQWDDYKPIMVWCMLNPSTADEDKNDPTIERCERRARKAGYGGIYILNIFAFRATDPKDMKVASDPQGYYNDLTIVSVIQTYCDLNTTKQNINVHCGWGTHGSYRGRGKEVLGIIKQMGAIPVCLTQNANGSPKHPLYCSYELNFKPME